VTDFEFYKITIDDLLDESSLIGDHLTDFK